MPAAAWLPLSNLRTKLLPPKANAGLAHLAAVQLLRGAPQAGPAVVVREGAAGGSIITLEDALRKARREANDRPDRPDVLTGAEGR
jgi:hypothetical protein